MNSLLVAGTPPISIIIKIAITPMTRRVLRSLFTNYLRLSQTKSNKPLPIVSGLGYVQSFDEV